MKVPIPGRKVLIPKIKVPIPERKASIPEIKIPGCKV